MIELWTPSDDLLAKDWIASQQIEHAHDMTGLEQAGLQFPDVADDAANEAAAALCSAESAGDDGQVNGESGECADDDEVADPEGDETFDNEI